MTTVYRNSPIPPAAEGRKGAPYSTYLEPDTRIPPKAAPVLGEVSVNGVRIPEQEILAEAQNHPAANPGGALRAAAEALVVGELLWQEAQRLDVPAAPVRDEAGRAESERDAAIRGLVDREVQAPSATAGECRRFYDRHPERFRTPPLFEARHILVAAPESDPRARMSARRQAVELCRLLAGHPERFESCARAHSACPSRESGGNLGQLGPGSTVPEFEQALKGMRAGEITTAPVESRFGFHVVALDRRIEGRALPYEIVAERIAAWLEAAAWSKAVAQYIAVLAGRADIRGISLNGAGSPLVQ